MVHGFDHATGGNILDAGAVKEAASGVDTIVHVAGIAGDRGRDRGDTCGQPYGHCECSDCGRRAKGSARRLYVFGTRAWLAGTRSGLPSARRRTSRIAVRPVCAQQMARRRNVSGLHQPHRRHDDLPASGSGFRPGGLRKGAGRTGHASPPGNFWPLGVHIDVRDVATAVAAAVRCDAPAIPACSFALPISRPLDPQ